MGNITSRSTIGASQVTNAGATSNDADEELDLYISDNLTVLIDDGNAAVLTDVTAAFDWTRNGLFVLKDDASAPTGAITITVPNTPRARITFKNETGFDATVTIAGQSETADVVAAGTAAVFASDGSNIRIAGGGGGTGDFVSLSDTPGTIAANQFVKGNGAGDALVFGNPAGDALPFTLSPAWQGCELDLTADITTVNATSGYDIAFDSEVSDTNAFHDNATNNTRITIQAGITKIEFFGGVKVELAATSDRFLLQVRKNGAATPSTPVASNELTSATNWLAVATGPISVVEGDYFELRLLSETDTSVTVAQGNTVFRCTVVETTDTVPSLRTVVVSLPGRKRGAVVTKSADETGANYSGNVKIPFNTVYYDTDGLFDDASDTFIIPAGVSAIRLFAGTRATLVTSSNWHKLAFVKTTDISGFEFTTRAHHVEISQTTVDLHHETGVIRCGQGDAFEIRFQTESDTSITLAQSTFFGIEIVEFNSSTDAVQAYIAVPPEHKGASLSLSPAQSISDGAASVVENWNAVLHGSNSFDPGDGGPAQRFWLGADTVFVDGDVTVANDEITETAHGFQTGEGPVTLTSSGTLPAGLATATKYWVIRVDADTLKFATSRANALADTDVVITAAAGGGNHTIETAEKLVIPAGVARAKFKGGGQIDTSVSVVRAFCRISEGLTPTAVQQFTSGTDADIFPAVMCDTGVLDVAEGEFYVLEVFQDSAGAEDLLVDVRTSFEIEVVEESRAITYPGVTVTPPFVGVQTSLASAIADADLTGQAVVEWDTEDVNTDGFWALSPNPSRFTIPTGRGIRRVTLCAMIHFINQTADGGDAGVVIHKNGAATEHLTRHHASQDAAVTRSSLVVLDEPVADGDYFEVLAFSSGADITVGIGADSYFRMTITETDENAFPPEPVDFFINGTPGTSDLIYQKVAARRFTLSDNFAGSEAYLETAPSGGALVFDVDRNGTKIGEIQFADGVKTATFVTTAGATEVFDVGDRLGIDSPADLLSAADLSIALWAWRS